jgi:hypothetical protein
VVNVGVEGVEGGVRVEGVVSNGGVCNGNWQREVGVVVKSERVDVETILVGMAIYTARIVIDRR